MKPHKFPTNSGKRKKCDWLRRAILDAGRGHIIGEITFGGAVAFQYMPRFPKAGKAGAP